MRRALLFALVFGVGLTVLLLVERGGRAPRRTEPAGVERTADGATGARSGSGETGAGGTGGPGGESPGAETSGAGATSGATGAPSGQPPGEAGGAQGVPHEPDARITGEGRFRVFDEVTGRPAYEVHADDFQPSGGPRDRRYRVRGLTIELFDPASGVKRETVRAASGTFRMLPAASPEGLRIADGGRLELADVHVTEHLGGPLVPLDLFASSVELRLETDSLRSLGDEPVRVVGPGLEASGLGLVAEGAAGTLVLERGGSVRFQRADEPPVTFTTGSDGRIEITNPTGGDSFVADATGGAELVLESGADERVRARRMLVHGRVVDGAARVERAEAEDSVRVERGPDAFEGDGARVRLDELGRFEQVVVERNPRASLVIEDESGRVLPLRMDGAGPLTVDVVAGAEMSSARFVFGGPATLTAPPREITMSAAGSLSGQVDEARRIASIEARDDVELRQGERSARTESLDALFLAGDEEAVDVLCVGPTQLVWRDSSGAPTTLDASQRAELSVRGREWKVPLAVGVRLSGAAEERFRTTADRIEDFDGVHRTFVAEGEVSWTSVLGEGSAERAVSRGSEGASLFGVPGRPASVRVVGEGDAYKGRFEAGEIELAPTFAEARGGVRAELEAHDVDLTLASDFARLERGAVTEESGESFTLEARVVGSMSLVRPGETLRASGDELLVRGTFLPERNEPTGPGETEPGQTGPDPTESGRSITATRALLQGTVVVEREGAYALRAEGQRLELEVGRAGRLEGEDGVRARGGLPGRSLDYRLDASWLEFDAARLEADRPRMTAPGPLFAVEGTPVGEGGTTIEAGNFRADVLGVFFTGDVRLNGKTVEGLPVTLEAEEVRLGGTLRPDLEIGELAGAIRSVEARGGVLLLWGGLGFARCDRLRGTRERLLVEGSPAVVDAFGHSLESVFMDLDTVEFLFASERGVLRAPEAAGGGSVEFAAVRPIVTPNGTMLALSNPVFRAGKDEARTQFAALWIHEERWRARGREALWGEPPVPGGPAATSGAPSVAGPGLLTSVFTKLASGQLAKLVRSVWLEGDVEATTDGALVARADEVYLDLEARYGKLLGAELAQNLQFGSREQRVRTKAAEILSEPDGSLTAEKATLTACEHDDPHYVVEVGQLVLAPRGDGSWRFGARENKLRFQGGFGLPLPSLGNLVLDEAGDFVGFEDDAGNVRSFDEIALRDTARFGTTLGARVRSDIGSVGRAISRVVGFGEDQVSGEWEFEGAWLSARGPLLGVGLSLTEQNPDSDGTEHFWLNLYAKGIPDEGPDRGLVRVPEDERDTFRHWEYVRGRYPFSDREWIDIAYTTQSDPGVQAEFFQSEFQRFEERDNYLHWRKADDGRYLDASVKLRVDDFRTEVEERPSAGFYRGLAKIASVGPFALQYLTAFDIDELSRRAGDPRYEDVFRDFTGQPDGLGDREVFRLDNRHRVELPMPTGVAGIHATPYLEGRATLWDAGVEEEDRPRRAALLGGMELATTLHKTLPSGYLHSLSPSLSYSGDLALDEHDGTPVRFDQVDDPLDGEELELGLRTLWRKPGSPNALDLELRGARRTDRAEGLDDSDEVTVLGELRTEIFGRPFALRHDGRFDLGDGETLYSRSTLAVAPTTSLLFELGFRRARGLDGGGLFEAASFDTVFVLDPKWELEVGQAISISGNDTLKSEFLLRRFSHDFLLEMGVSHRAGEGSTFGIAFRPLFLYRPPGRGLLDEKD